MRRGSRVPGDIAEPVRSRTQARPDVRRNARPQYRAHPVIRKHLPRSHPLLALRSPSGFQPAQRVGQSARRSVATHPRRALVPDRGRHDAIPAGYVICDHPTREFSPVIRRRWPHRLARHRRTRRLGRGRRAQGLGRRRRPNRLLWRRGPQRLARRIAGRAGRRLARPDVRCEILLPRTLPHHRSRSVST